MRKTLLALWIILLGAFSAPASAANLYRPNHGPYAAGYDYCFEASTPLAATESDARKAWAEWANANPGHFHCNGVTDWTSEGCYGPADHVCRVSNKSSTYWITFSQDAPNPCTGEQTWSYVSQTCTAKCASDATLPANHPNCVAPPSACLNKATEQVAYQVTTGLTANTYCDGSCDFTVEFNNDRTTCWNYDGSTTRYCDFDKVYPGTECTVSDNMATDTNATNTGGTITAGTGAQT